MGALFSGLIHVTGEHDVGKTTFAITCGVKPAQMMFVDDDLKASSIAEELEKAGKPFGKYVNLVDKTAGMKELDMHSFCLKMIDDIPVDKYEAIVWDTWTRFEDTFQPFVEKNPSLFRDKWSPMGSIKGAQMWQTSFDYEAKILSKLKSKTKLLIIITHLKSHSIGGVKTGKMIPACKRTILQKSDLRIWLRHNPDNPAPIGLVLKRIGRRTINSDGVIGVVSVVPRRIVPCTWDKIKEYWDKPIGNREPTEEEMPNEFELSILDDTLTDDQKMIMKLSSTINKESEDSFDEEKMKQIRELKDNDKSLPVIAREVGLSVPEVARYLAKSKEE